MNSLDGVSNTPAVDPDPTFDLENAVRVFGRFTELAPGDAGAVQPPLEQLENTPESVASLADAIGSVIGDEGAEFVDGVDFALNLQDILSLDGQGENRDAAANLLAELLNVTDRPADEQASAVQQITDELIRVIDRADAPPAPSGIDFVSNLVDLLQQLPPEDAVRAVDLIEGLIPIANDFDSVVPARDMAIELASLVDGELTPLEQDPLHIAYVTVPGFRQVAEIERAGFDAATEIQQNRRNNL